MHVEALDAYVVDSARPKLLLPAEKINDKAALDIARKTLVRGQTTEFEYKTGKNLLRSRKKKAALLVTRSSCARCCRYDMSPHTRTPRYIIMRRANGQTRNFLSTFLNCLSSIFRKVTYQHPRCEPLETFSVPRNPSGNPLGDPRGVPWGPLGGSWGSPGGSPWCGSTCGGGGATCDLGPGGSWGIYGP